MPARGAVTRVLVTATSPPHLTLTRQEIAMTAHTRRIRALALVTLAIIGASAPAAAFADPDTNIQKPGHVL
jgi:hypothetical protein